MFQRDVPGLRRPSRTRRSKAAGTSCKKTAARISRASSLRSCGAELVGPAGRRTARCRRAARRGPRDGRGPACTTPRTRSIARAASGWSSSRRAGTRRSPASMSRRSASRFRADIGYVTAKVGADGAVFDDDDRILLVTPGRRRRGDSSRAGSTRTSRPSRRSCASSPRSSASPVGSSELVGRVLPPRELRARTALGDLGRLPLLDHVARASRCSRTRSLDVAWRASTTSPSGTSTTTMLARGARERVAAPRDRRREPVRCSLAVVAAAGARLGRRSRRAESALARFASWRSESRSTKCARTPRTWVGAAASRSSRALRR